MARKFTVTLPDGSIATRTSAKANYTHAVVFVDTREARVAEAQGEVDRLRASIALFEAALADGTIVEGLADQIRRVKDSLAYAERSLAKEEDGPAERFDVIRWSSRRDLAEKALRGEVGSDYHTRHGRRAYVVEVDA